jgi:hypothetical protein
MRIIFLILILFFSVIKTVVTEDAHLFILSGQSNMEKIDMSLFYKLLRKDLKGKEIIIAKHAKGGLEIKYWAKQWMSVDGGKAREDIRGVMYKVLLKKIFMIPKKYKLITCTLVWMQGESDAKESGIEYEDALFNLYTQFSRDLNRNDINFIIGRISDYGFNDKKYPDWQKVRTAQENFVKKVRRTALINTDDLNNVLNEKTKKVENQIHYTAEGYKVLCERFAKKSIEMILKAKKKN